MEEDAGSQVKACMGRGLEGEVKGCSRIPGEGRTVHSTWVDDWTYMVCPSNALKFC